MFIKTRISISLSLIALLGACGGGGGGFTSTAPNTTVQQAVVSTASFALAGALSDDLDKSYTRTFTISGTVAGEALSGSGQESSFGLAQGSVGSSVGLLKTIRRDWNWSTGSGSNSERTTGYSRDAIYDASNQLMLDSVFGQGGYTAYVNGTPSLPITARVNDSGNYYTANMYTDQTRTTQIGTSVATYAVLPDTATTALLKITTVNQFTASGFSSSEARVLRITPAGASTLVSSTIQDSSGLTTTYTYQ